MRWNTVISCILCVSLHASAVGTEPPSQGANALIPAADLQADAKIVREALEALHPGLYRYNAKEAIDQRFDALTRFLSSDRTRDGVFVELSRFLATLQCGHSYCNFYNQPGEVVEQLFKNSNRVPFHFRWIDRRMIVTASRSDSPALKPGVEIVSIDTIEANEILNRLLPIARADGSNDAKRVKYLEVTGEDRYEAFDIFLPLLVPEIAPPFEIVLADPMTGERSSVQVAPITYESRIEPRRAAAAALKSGEPIWTWTALDDRTAYVRMPTWALFNSSWDWRTWLTQRLDQLVADTTPNLIIDLRGNEGGLDCGDPLLARLLERDLSLVQNVRHVRYRKTPESLNPYLDTWDKSFRDWGEQAKPVEAPVLLAGGANGTARDFGVSFFRLSRYDDEGISSVIKPVGPRYAGNVFVIVNSACSSATFQFAQTVRRERLATIVGEPTGGNQRGINGGAFFFCRLPHSKIEFDIPLIASVPSVANGASLPPDAGVEPDVRVSASVMDIARGVDTELEAVRRLIRESK